MAYADQQDIIDIYGDEQLYNVAVLKEDRTPDEDKVATALDRASSEVDAYLTGRYQVPLQSPGQQIKQVTVDIAMYRMALSLGHQTKEHRLRYEDAIKFLTLAAAGTKGIGIGDDATDDAAEGQDDRRIRVSFYRRA